MGTSGKPEPQKTGGYVYLRNARGWGARAPMEVVEELSGPPVARIYTWISSRMSLRRCLTTARTSGGSSWGWAFITGPALIAAVVFLRHEYSFRRLCAAVHLGLVAGGGGAVRGRLSVLARACDLAGRRASL